MKARVDIENRFINAYPDSYAFPEDWILVEITLEQLKKICEFGKAKLENGIWVKIDPTQEELDLQLQEEMYSNAKSFMQQKKLDGSGFYNDMDLRITIGLSAVERNILFPKLAEIDSLLYPPLYKIKTGDFASALYIFQNQSIPSDEFVLNFYNEALTYCQTYYDTKYPK